MLFRIKQLNFFVYELLLLLFYFVTSTQLPLSLFPLGIAFLNIILIIQSVDK